MNGVSQELFKGYLTGGRCWPQIRGGINTSLFKVWTDNFQNNDQILQLAQSRLSEKQIKMSRQIMTSDHIKAGISFKNPISDTQLEKEWYLAKQGVVNTLKYLKEHDQKIENEEELITYSSQLNISTTEMAKFQKMAFTVYQLVMKDNKDLSLLFRVSFFQKLPDPLFLNGITNKYGLPPINKRNQNTISQLCCKIMSQIIQENCKKLDCPHEWATWGFVKKKRDLT